MLFDICDVLIKSEYFTEIVLVSSEEEITQYESYDDITYLRENEVNGVDNAVELGNKYFIEKGFDATVVIPGDIPLIHNKVLDELFNLIKDNQVIITPSRKKNGTNLLFRSPPDVIGTSYDNNSYFRHLDMIKAKNLQHWIYLEDSIRLDLDEPEDIKIINERLLDSRTKNLLKKFN
uniref:Hypothetical conserved protein (CofC) n=1 Tax=uncultured marine thaumarchaeote KM3_54_F04 TaxID=1456191 RepID=A0A075H6N2_9ARCH|nr:hypothetical conserved protein (cofC) [uncultured marine thaumarchaeote KM3_54_F04]